MNFIEGMYKFTATPRQLYEKRVAPPNREMVMAFISNEYTRLVELVGATASGTTLLVAKILASQTPQHGDSPCTPLTDDQRIVLWIFFLGFGGSYGISSLFLYLTNKDSLEKQPEFQIEAKDEAGLFSDSATSSPRPLHNPLH